MSNAHAAVNAEIAKGAALKHVEATHDASAPKIEKDVHIGKNPLPAALAELTSEEHKLKHVQPNEKHDASAPVTTGAKVGANPMTSVLAEVGSGSAILAHNKINKEISTGEHQLKHVEVAHDGSKPQIDSSVTLREAPQKKVFEEIGKEHALKHVEVAHDASAPKIDPSVKIGEAPMKAVLSEIAATGVAINANLAYADVKKEVEAGQVALKHVEVAHDASKPQIESSVTLREAPQKKVFEEIGKEHALKHVEVAHDASAPKIDPNVKIGAAPQKALLGEIQAQATTINATVAHAAVKAELTSGDVQLKHVTVAHDASKPQIDSSVTLREAPQKKVFEEIGKEHALKHVEVAHDASAPKIEKDVKIGEAPQKKVLEEIKKADK